MDTACGELSFGQRRLGKGAMPAERTPWNNHRLRTDQVRRVSQKGQVIRGPNSGPGGSIRTMRRRVGGRATSRKGRAKEEGVQQAVQGCEVPPWHSTKWVRRVNSPDPWTVREPTQWWADDPNAPDGHVKSPWPTRSLTRDGQGHADIRAQRMPPPLASLRRTTHDGVARGARAHSITSRRSR